MFLLGTSAALGMQSTTPTHDQAATELRLKHIKDIAWHLYDALDRAHEWGLSWECKEIINTAEKLERGLRQ